MVWVAISGGWMGGWWMVGWVEVWIGASHDPDVISKQ
jgi:hypothetical protein